MKITGTIMLLLTILKCCIRLKIKHNLTMSNTIRNPVQNYLCNNSEVVSVK